MAKREWFGIVDKTTGDLVSVATVVVGQPHPDTGEIVPGKPNPDHEVVPFGAKEPDFSLEGWDPGLRQMVPVLRPTSLAPDEAKELLVRFAAGLAPTEFSKAVAAAGLSPEEEMQALAILKGEEPIK